MNILQTLYMNQDTHMPIKTWLLQQAKVLYVSDVHHVASPHFSLCTNATHLHTEQIQDFSFEQLAIKLCKEVPALWQLMESLLASTLLTASGKQLIESHHACEEEESISDARMMDGSENETKDIKQVTPELDEMGGMRGSNKKRECSAIISQLFPKIFERHHNEGSTSWNSIGRKNVNDLAISIWHPLGC